MRIRIDPGSQLDGSIGVPGDKSIAHRWLILAITARGRSLLEGLPASLDVRSTAACLAEVSRSARPALEAWRLNSSAGTKGNGSTWNLDSGASEETGLEVEGEGFDGLGEPVRDLDCGNSGTSMRLLCGVLAGVPFVSVLVGDASLSVRPMERVAEPLRQMGARVKTTGGLPPLTVEGGMLHGIEFRGAVPSAQVKGAVLLAGLSADGRTAYQEPARTRDHTERALAALGAPVEVVGSTVSVRAFQHGGFSGRVPGDPSSAAFLVAAAALTGSELTIAGVGLNPSRTRFLDVMRRMGVVTESRIDHEEMGEPVGDLRVAPAGRIEAIQVDADELPLVIDEVPVLALMAAHAESGTRFLGAAELRHKESNRLDAIARGIGDLGGRASVVGDALIVDGGGLSGGSAEAAGDHRLAMAFAVGALRARSSSEISGIEAADVSFPGFASVLSSIGANVEVVE